MYALAVICSWSCACARTCIGLQSKRCCSLCVCARVCVWWWCVRVCVCVVVMVGGSVRRGRRSLVELGQYAEAHRALARANTLDPGQYQEDLDEVAQKLAASQPQAPPAQPTVPPPGQQQAAPNAAPPAGGGGANASASPLGGLEALFSNPALAGMVPSYPHDGSRCPPVASKVLRHEGTPPSPEREGRGEGIAITHTRTHARTHAYTHAYTHACTHACSAQTNSA